MNQAFAEATTGVAFVLTLSKRQANTLLRLKAHEAMHGKPKKPSERDGGHDETCRNDSPAYIGIVNTDVLHPLLDRGLVFWDHDEQCRPCGFGGLTKAGELAADLLLEAGLTIDATNTLSVLKRLRRAA